METRSSRSLNTVIGPQDRAYPIGLVKSVWFHAVGAGERKMVRRMPILRHNNEPVIGMEHFGKTIYGSNYLVSAPDSKSTGWHEIVLHIDYDERIWVLDSNALCQIQLLKSH
jgi:hypothetical protein